MSVAETIRVRQRWADALSTLASKRPNRNAADPWAALWSLTPPF